MESEKNKESQKKSKESLVTKQIRENPWMLSTLVLGILVLILVIGSTNVAGNVVSEDEIGGAVVSYFEDQGASGLELVSAEEVQGLYEVKTNYMGQKIPFYVTKTGYLIAGNELVPLFGEEKGLDKAAVPVVELFVMTHCPYGTQAEKGIIPVFEELGDSIEGKIRFVHYFMHEPEETETPIQLCIREEQSEKYLDYLKCFLEDGDSERCQTETGIDKTALQDCIDSGRADEYYAEDSALSQEYGVQGSPTLVINGEQVNSGRDPVSYLDSICVAFSDVPEECGSELSSEAPSPGFGWEGTGSSSGAQCG